MTLYAAATSVDVTPPPGHPLGGYLSRHDALSTGTHDPLTATLVHVSGETDAGVVWVALDALGIDAATAERIRDGVASATGTSADAVLVCASHTHSGPDAWLPRTQSFTGRPPDGRLVAGLVGGVVGAAGGLTDRRRPVTATWGVTRDVGVGTNRNDPAGPHDDTAGVLALRDDEGATVAAVVDYACHPTVLSHDNLRYSADYPGPARSVAAAALAEAGDGRGRRTPPVVAFLQGAAGDASPRFTRRGQSFAEAARLGGMLGAATVHAALAGDGTPLRDTPSVHRDTVELPVRTLPGPAELRAHVERTEAAWRRTADRPAAPEARIARSRYEGALLLARQSDADLPESMSLPIAVVTFGDVAWAHVPVELFASLGFAVAGASPFPHTRVVGYTDHYLGYVADAAAHAAETYEASSSFFDAAAGDALVDAVVALLKRASTA